MKQQQASQYQQGPIQKPFPGREPFRTRQSKERVQNIHNWHKDKSFVDTKESKNVWIIHNKQYDLTDFISKHPGGSHWLQLTEGQDITDYYETYHLDEEKLRPFLEKYEVMNRINENQINKNAIYDYHQDDFYKTLKKRVFKVFKTTESRKASYLMNFYCALIFLIWIAAFINMGISQSTASSILAGLLLANLIGIAHNFMHQRKSLWSNLMAFTLFPSYIWQTTHNISHHTYTNLELDIEITSAEPLLIFLTSQKENPKIAIIYQFIAYSMLPILHLRAQLFRQNIFYIEHGQKIFPDYVCLAILNFGFSICILGWILQSSMAMVTNDSLYNDIVFLIFRYLMQWTMYILTVINTYGIHRNSSSWTEGDAGGQRDFGKHILMTTDDFLPNLPLFLSLFLFQGFNYHQAHHLFPTIDISQMYKVRTIIKDTCKEFGLEKQFQEKNYFFLVWTSFVTHLIRKKGVPQ